MEEGQKIMETSRDNFFFFFFGRTHFSCWFTNVIKMTIVKHFKTNRISFSFSSQMVFTVLNGLFVGKSLVLLQGIQVDIFLNSYKTCSYLVWILESIILYQFAIKYHRSRIFPLFRLMDSLHHSCSLQRIHRTENG